MEWRSPATPTPRALSQTRDHQFNLGAKALRAAGGASRGADGPATGTALDGDWLHSSIAGDAQVELAHAHRVAILGQLMASIAHEVKQPVAGTVANAQAALRWLGGRTPDLEQAREALADIVKTGKRTSEVIDRLCHLVAKVPPRKNRLEINGMIREVVELSGGEAMKNGVSVETRLAENLPLIQGDRVQLQQVVLNLIVNAVQAMGAAAEGTRELLVTTSQAAEHDVLIAVKDTGPGLAPANVGRVFDAFYTTKPCGLGMGLSICRSIIEAHGGRLWASANAPRGTIFQFTVPVRRARRYRADGIRLVERKKEKAT